MNNPKSNQILSALSQQEYYRLDVCLEPVRLNLDQILIEANQKTKSLYFPTQGVVSLISIMQDGSTTEIGLIGNEGMVGTLQFLGQGVANSRAVVQANGWATKIDAEVLRVEFNRGKMLQKLLLRYALKLFNQIGQCAACNNHHTVKQRTARWLLMLDDRSDHETLSMTHQLLSKMLGVRRTGVTEVASKFQKAGILQYKRGLIKINSEEKLEDAACECYWLIDREFSRLLEM